MSELPVIDTHHMYNCPLCDFLIDLTQYQVNARILLPNISIECPKCKVYSHFLTLELNTEEENEK